MKKNKAETKGLMITKVQTYTVTVKHYEDGSYNMHRKNDGFDTLELLGALTLVTDEIIKLIKGCKEFAPKEVTREVVVDK